MKPRRILLVVRTLGLGGMERMTVNLANSLHRQGNEVHLLVFKRRLDLLPEEGIYLHVCDFERLFRFSGIGAIYDLFSRALTRFFFRRAKTLLHSFYFGRLFTLWLKHTENQYGRMDLIIARGYGSFQGLAGVKDNRLVRVIVNEQWESPEDPWDRRFFNSSFHSTKVVFNSTYNERAFHELARRMDVRPQLTRVLRNPTDLQRIRQDSLGDRPLQSPYIVSVGRLEKAKNHQLLLSAFSRIKSQVPHQLVLVGKGNLETALRRQAEELGISSRVCFVGQQKNPYPWISNASLFVLPSLHEGLPNVVIEALACLTPVVVTRGTGGTVELMVGELTEFIAEMNPESLAEKMVTALQRPPRIDAGMVESFSMDVVAQEYLAIAQSSSFGSESDGNRTHHEDYQSSS